MTEQVAPEWLRFLRAVAGVTRQMGAAFRDSVTCMVYGHPVDTTETVTMTVSHLHGFGRVKGHECERCGQMFRRSLV